MALGKGFDDGHMVADAVWVEMRDALMCLRAAARPAWVATDVAVWVPESFVCAWAEALWPGAVLHEGLGQVCRFDRALVVCAGEEARLTGPLLDTLGQVLRPDGLVVMVLPHLSLWTLRPGFGPFGFGVNYTLGDVERLLQTYGLKVLEHRLALWAPPMNVCWRAGVLGRLLRWLALVLGRLALPLMGGALVLTACKDDVAVRPVRPAVNMRCVRVATEPLT